MAKSKAVKKKVAAKQDFFRYNSISTPDFKHPAYCIAAEIITVRHATEDGVDLPPYFWRTDIPCDAKYKKEYSEGVKCMRHLMKDVPAHFIIQCIIYTKQINYANYGYIKTVIKNKWERWNNNMVRRVNNIIKAQAVREVAVEEMLELASSTGEYEETKGRKRKVKL